MDLLLLSVIAVVALALLFDFSNGFHDAANSIATVVATRVLPARVAVWFSAACNFLAYFFVGTGVADTIAKTVKPGHEGLAVVFAALVAAVAWNYATWYLGLPSSSSHAVIGGLVGAGIAAGGLDAIKWSTVRTTVIAIAVSPLVAMGVAALATLAVNLLQKVTRWGDDAVPFKGLQLVSAAAVSFGHGANDAQKTMGVIAALLAGTGYLTVAPGSDTIAVPEWVALSAYSAIALGTIWGGWRIIETMGLKLTRLDAKTAVAANIGAVTAIFGATERGIPVSTTHAAASSVVGAGVSARRGVGWRVIGEMSAAWAITLPCSALAGAGLYGLTQLPLGLAWLTVGSALAALGAWIVHAMRNAIGADDVAAELPAVPAPRVVVERVPAA